MAVVLQKAMTVDSNHPSLAGHFPDAPIVPGVVLLDWVIQALDCLVGSDINTVVCQVDSVKFLHPVLPGDLLDISISQKTALSYGFTITKQMLVVTIGKLTYTKV